MHGYKWPINCTRTRTSVAAILGELCGLAAPPAPWHVGVLPGRIFDPAGAAGVGLQLYRAHRIGGLDGRGCLGNGAYATQRAGASGADLRIVRLTRLTTQTD